MKGRFYWVSITEQGLKVGDKVKIKSLEQVKKYCRLWEDRPNN